jgi:RNA polymerase sigma-70 factor (ECF subfamily)
MSRDGDAELVRRCRRGEAAACDLLLTEYEKPVYNVAFRMLHDVDDAQDVTQTVFMKVFASLDRYDPSYRLFSWIYRIAVNESIDLVQQRSRLRPLEGHEPTQSSGPEDACGQAEVGAAIESVLMNMKDEYRAVLVLRHFADLSYEEMSEVVEVPVKTVKSRLFTARRLLRDALVELGHLRP